MNDKLIETRRYNIRAESVDTWEKYSQAIHEPLYLRPPSALYKKFVSEIKKGSLVLEIGAGMGEHTQDIVTRNLRVCATDISSKSVEVMNKRFAKFDNFSSRVVDMESMPFERSSFDVVCCAAGLSYGDNLTVLNEIYRVLKPGGTFICMDSLNHNIIYKINRYIHYLRGNRSRSTLKRMPTQNLIESYKGKFGQIEVNYFGSFIWITPVVRHFLTEASIERLVTKLDFLFDTERSAFKFTMRVTKL